MARRLTRVVRVLLFVSLASASASAWAEEECPVGSTMKSEKGQSWCEPSVCELDSHCLQGMICRPVPLCVEIGVLDQAPGAAKIDAGQKLIVRQRCGENKSCPQNTTCTEKGRCITRAQADKAGLLAPAGAASASAASEPPKKSCGCHLPGTSSGGLGAGALAVIGAVAISLRRRRA